MDWLWTWGGECFGYRDGDELRTHDGRLVGRFVDDEVYGSDGRYLGELRNEDRLITHQAKLDRSRAGFAPSASAAAHARYGDKAAVAMCAGYEDFPSADDLG